ncbi:MAG: hypothetical protein M1839_004040 [Geoglossum umbratile]|nr:MAG: hypothetical protein M1839_004040 [Geoglossum umbratile]
MEQPQPPKRRGRPPKNPIANTTRLKKPVTKPLGPERRQTRHSRAESESLPAAGHINLLRDPSNYQITLVDVKSSYSKETGMFTISGLRRGMIDVGSWSSASVAPDSPKRPRVEIDLTLSDSDNTSAGGNAKALTRPSPRTKRKAADDENISESTVGDKRQKMSVEFSNEAALAEAPTVISTKEPPPSPRPLIGLMEVNRSSQSIATEEGRYFKDLLPSSLSGFKDLLPTSLTGRQGPSPSAYNMNMHIRPNANLHPNKVAPLTNDLEAQQGNVSNRRTDGSYNVMGNASSEAKSSMYAPKNTPSGQIANSLRTREGIPSAQADSQNQQFEQRKPTANPSKFGQATEAMPKALITTEVRSEPSGLGDAARTEPGSTLEAPIIVDDSDESSQPSVTSVQRTIRKEQISTKQVAGPKLLAVSNHTKIGLEPQKRSENPPISGEQQTTSDLRTTLGEQTVIPVKKETSDDQAIAEEKAIALAKHEDVREQGVRDKQTGFEEETVAVVEHKAQEERAISEEGVAFTEQRIAEGPIKENSLEEEVEALGEQRTAVATTIAGVRLMTPAEQAVALIMEGTPGKPTTVHSSQPIPKEQEAANSGVIILDEREAVVSDEHTILNEQAIPKDETVALSSQTISNESVIPDQGVISFDIGTNWHERGFHIEEPIVIDEQVTPRGHDVSSEDTARPGEQMAQATQEDTVAFGEQAISNNGALSQEITRDGETMVTHEKAIPDGKEMALDCQVMPDEEVKILNEQAIPVAQTTPDKQIASSEQPGLGEQTPQWKPSHKGIDIATTGLAGGPVDDGNGHTHPPWQRGFSGEPITTQREQLEPPNISKECPVCKERFRDMSIPVSDYAHYIDIPLTFAQDLRQHILSCLEEERPQPPEYADEEYLGLVRRTTVFLEDLGSDNGVDEDLDDDLHIDGPPILNGSLGIIAGFRDTPMSDSERTLSEPASDGEQLPKPYEEKGTSSDEIDSPALDATEAMVPSRFRTITDPEKFLPSLKDPEVKSTASLYRSIENAADVLKAWQDEWMVIEARVAKLQQRKAHNPRAVPDSVVFEDQKEADLYGYRWDPNPKKRGQQDPAAQRIGRLVGGRELRRRAPAVKALAVDSDAGTQDGGRLTRSRRGDGASDPNGSGVEGGRPAVMQNGVEISSNRRGVKRSADLIDADTPEQSDAPKRRGRPRLNPLPARIQDIRNGNAFSATSTESEGTPAPVIKRRGRPPKNLKANQAPGAKTENTEDGKGGQKADRTGGSTSGAPIGVGPSEVVKKPKSAKRSAAMQAWWDHRKAEKRARMEAATATNAAPDANASVAGPSTSIGKPTREVGSVLKAPKDADKGDTQIPQKRRGRPPKQPPNPPVEAPKTDEKVHQPKRRGRPPKSGLKGPLAKPLPNVDGGVGHGGLPSAVNPLPGKPTEFTQHQQLVGGSVPDKKRRNLAGGDDASGPSKRARISPSSFNSDSDAMQSTESSSNDIDDDGDDSYYG